MVTELRRLDVAFSDCVLLIDARALGVQPLDSVSAFASLIGGSVDQPLRSALVLKSALFNLQGQRMTLPRQRIFFDVEEAVSWLGLAYARATQERIPA